MHTPARLSWLRLAAILCGVVVAAGSSSAAETQGDQSLSQLVARVDPAVVKVTVGNDSQGSGFVVNPHGMILTNYHVIEGAREATVVFPDKSSFRVEGFLKISPGKDLALLRIQPQGKQLPWLKVAATPPARGERVFAFGAPMGLGGSVSDGIVAALRSGEEMRQTLRELAKSDVYTEVLGYDADARWIQMTAPVSPGNSGGPLVNSRGEVVGINTWVHALGQNLNFALSSETLQQFLANVTWDVQPLTALPKPRPESVERRKGDAKKTLAVWNQVNALKVQFSKKRAAFDKRFQQASRPTKALAARLQKMAAVYADLAKLYEEYAGELRALELNGVDAELVLLTIAEADLAQRFSEAHRQLASATASNNPASAKEAERYVNLLDAAVTELRTVRDLVRVRLGNKYELTFPALETAMKEAEAAEKASSELTDDTSTRQPTPGDAAAASATAKQDVLRVWTDRTGKFQVQATFLGISAGKVKLRKADGTVIAVPLDKLSEADQRFIGADKMVE